MTNAEYGPLPSAQFLKWIRDTLLAQEKRTGQKAPRHYHEWISRVQDLHGGKALADVLTAEEFAALKEMAIDAENTELWSLIPTQIETREVTKQPMQAMLDAQIVSRRGAY